MTERYGDFELLRLIATGGMAEIYLGRATGAMEGFARNVVVKRMLPQLAVRPDFVQMFLDEARLAANLNHPNIVSVTNLGEVDKSYFIAMELVDGPHLGALFAHSLRLRKPLPIELCCYIVARAADGLHYAHEQNDPSTGQALMLVHRDISPQNILVSRGGEVKVTDFGVAKASTHQTKTRTGIIKGKVAYMSPEQCLGEVVDRRTDVFALGIVMYELLTRRRLFRDKSDLLIMQKITGEDVPAPSTLNKELDAELDTICKKALTRSKEERFANAADLAEALDAWLANHANGDPRATLERWFEANAADLAVSAGEVTQAHIATSSMPRAASPAEITAATPSLNSAETVMTKSRPEERLPSRASILGEKTSPASSAPGGTLSGGEPSEEEAQTLLDAGAALQAGRAARRDAGARAPDIHASETAQLPRAPGLDRIRDTGELEPVKYVEATDLGRSAKPKRSPALWAAGGGVVLLIAALAIVFLRRSDDPIVVTPTLGDAGAASDTATPPTPGANDEGLVPVTIDTVPSGVTIYIRDEKVGSSPVVVKRAPGELQIDARFGKEMVSKTVTVEAGSPMRVELYANVPLKITANVRAKVKINDTVVGETPFDLKGGVEPNATVRITLEAPGYVPDNAEVQPEPGQPAEYAAVLTKIERGAPPPQPPPPVAYGVLNVRPIGVEITGGKLDNERLPASIPFRDFKTRAGKRTLVLTNPAEKINERIPDIDIPPNGERTVIVEFEKRGDKWTRKKVTVR